MLHQPLLTKLNSGLDLNLARLKCLVLLISGVLRHRTVNLSILSTGNLSGSKNESCYRRFQNFFLKCVLPQSSVGRLILSKIPKPTKGWILSIDREFGGEKWLKWFEQKKVGYVVRVRKNILVNGKSAEGHPVTGKGKNKTLRSIMGMKVFFANKVIQSKGRRDSRLYVIINRFHGREALAIYRMRWGIEQLFSHLKKRGFDLEVTHMTNAAKLEMLFAVVSLAFLFSFGWGCHLCETRKSTVPMKRKSLFRIGLEGILRLLNNPHIKEEERSEFSDWFSSPIYRSLFVVSCELFLRELF